jgi:hypothetical protein
MELLPNLKGYLAVANLYFRSLVFGIPCKHADFRRTALIRRVELDVVHRAIRSKSVCPNRERGVSALKLNKDSLPNCW